MHAHVLHVQEGSWQQHELIMTSLELDHSPVEHPVESVLQELAHRPILAHSPVSGNLVIFGSSYHSNIIFNLNCGIVGGDRGSLIFCIII